MGARKAPMPPPNSPKPEAPPGSTRRISEALERIADALEEANRIATEDLLAEPVREL